MLDVSVRMSCSPGVGGSDGDSYAYGVMPVAERLDQFCATLSEMVIPGFEHFGFDACPSLAAIIGSSGDMMRRPRLGSSSRSGLRTRQVTVRYDLDAFRRVFIVLYMLILTIVTTGCEYPRRSVWRLVFWIAFLIPFGMFSAIAVLIY